MLGSQSSNTYKMANGNFWIILQSSISPEILLKTIQIASWSLKK